MINVVGACVVNYIAYRRVYHQILHRATPVRFPGCTQTALFQELWPEVELDQRPPIQLVTVSGWGT